MNSAAASDVETIFLSGFLICTNKMIMIIKKKHKALKSVKIKRMVGLLPPPKEGMFLVWSVCLSVHQITEKL